LVDEASDHLTPGSTGKPVRRQNVGARPLGPRGDGWEGFPIRGTYDQGVAWIVMTVARALHYAHDMHTFHRDVKPANVLLTLYHGPQLLDFNLADSPHSADQVQAALHGGTLPYMAPEQIEAFLNPQLWGKVEAKADIYSLGLVCRELLTGQMPELPPETLSPQRALRHLLDRRPFLEVSVRRLNPTLPHALDAIVAKCLTFSPDDRYPDAQALAQDLDRFLKHQRLVNATNPSRRERLGNWMRRHRRALAESVACLICLMLSVALLYPRINELLKPRIETLPDFQSAIEHLDQYESQRALELLLPLEQDYRQSPLLQLYLSFALDGDRKWKEAESHFAAVAAALGDPEVENTLVKWEKGHPEVVSFLEEFAETRFHIASDRTVNDVEKKSYEGEEEVVEDRKPYYKLARAALRLATRLKPDSQKALCLLAKAEDFFGDDFALANELITRSIDLAYSVTDEAKALARGEYIDNLIACRTVRCQIKTHLADFLRARGSSHDTSEAFEHMKTAEKDLQKLESLLTSSNAPVQPVKDHEFLETKLKAMLTLGETEMDHLRLADADHHLKRAKKTIGDWIDHANQTSLPISPSMLSKVNQRYNEDHSRLESLQGSQRSAAASSPSQTTRDGAHPDEPDRRLADANAGGGVADSGSSSKGAAVPRHD
jgi:serine/threonine protein kinase